VFYDVKGDTGEVLAIVPKAQAQAWLDDEGVPSEAGALAKVKDDFWRYLKLVASEEIVITRHARPAGVLIGFESEEDWFE
jgi:prevent-host-death family protein